MPHDRLHNKSTEENECMQDILIIIFHHHSAFYQTRPKASPTSSVPSGISRIMDSPQQVATLFLTGLGFMDGCNW